MVALDCSPARYAHTGVDKFAKFLHFADPLRKEALAFIKTNLPRPFIGVHIRQAFFPQCDKSGFSKTAAQCIKYLPPSNKPSNDRSRFPPEVCTGGGSDGMEADLATVAKSLGGVEGDPKWTGVSVFVASDAPVGAAFPWLIEKFNAKSIEGGLQDGETGYLRAQIDLTVLDLADHLIAHCPSGFSRAITRIREARKEPVSFWGVPGSLPGAAKEEL
eukprot:SAG25_NODE_491_length_7415_cov_6.908557_2_plen_217_part_00